MLRKVTQLLIIALAAVTAVGTVALADSATSIFDSGGLQYVKHVNNLPSGVTTLYVRNVNPVTTIARINFKARRTRPRSRRRSIRPSRPARRRSSSSTGASASPI